MLSHKLSSQTLFTAYAVVYLDKRGREIRRGIFSEENPTIIRPAVRTRCVATARSRRDFGRAQRLLVQKLGRTWAS